MHNPKILYTLRNGASLFSLRAGQAIFNLVIVTFLGRSLPDSILAQALFLLSLILASGRITVVGLDILLIKLLGKSEDEVGTRSQNFYSLGLAFLLLWGTGFVLIGCVWLILGRVPLLGDFGSPAGLIVLWVFLGALQVFQASALLGLGKQNLSFLYGGTFSTFVVMILIIATRVNGFTLTITTLVKIYLGSLIFNAVLSQITIHRLLEGGAKPRIAILGELWRSLLPAALTNLILPITAQLPLWVLVWFGNNTSVVDYGLSVRLVTPLTMITLAAQAMVLPLFSSAYHQGTLRQEEGSIRRITTLAAGIAFATSIFLLVFGNIIFEQVFGRTSDDLLWILSGLLAAQCVVASAGQCFMALRIGGLHVVAMWLAATAMAFQALSAFTLASRYEAGGVALSVVLNNLFMSIVALWIVRRAFGITTRAEIPNPFTRHRT